VIRKYDEALMKFLKLTVSDADVPLTFATPLKEFGEHEVVQDSPIPQSPKMITLPAMAVSRLNWTADAARYQEAIHRKLKWSDDLNLITQAQHPMAWDFAYQVDFLTKYRDDMNILMALTLIKFPRKIVMIPVDLGTPWGVKKISLIMGQVVDTTELESLDESSNRLCRMTLSLTLQGWLPLPSKDVRSVRTVLERLDVMWVEDRKGVDYTSPDVVIEVG
jgi:hypothetical protein